MSSLLSKAPFTGEIIKLLTGSNRAEGLEKAEVKTLHLTFAGIEGDFHAGLTRKSDVRTIRQYARDTDIRNVRQLTLVSEEELKDIAARMKIPEAKAEWLGANILTSSIPDLTLLTPSTRLQFPSGATLVVDMENFPCRQVSDVFSQHCSEPAVGFVTAALHKRGLTAWVEREGTISVGDRITLWIPQQRVYAHI